MLADASGQLTYIAIYDFTLVIVYLGYWLVGKISCSDGGQAGVDVEIRVG